MRTVDPSGDKMIWTRPIPLVQRDGTTAAEIIRSKTVQSGDCLLWVGDTDRDGYGRVTLEHESFLAHRVAYTVEVGPIPTGLTLDHHVCRTHACVTAAHLEPVTQQENARRRGRMTDTHCANGHAWDDNNLRTYERPNGRIDLLCRTCTRDHKRRQRAGSRPVSTTD